jgi:hypothetical protein
MCSSAFVTKAEALSCKRCGHEQSIVESQHASLTMTVRMYKDPTVHDLGAGFYQVELAP